MRSHVQINRKQRYNELTSQYHPGLVESLNIRVISIALIDQQFQFVILIITHPETEYRKKHPAFPLRLNQSLQFTVTGHAHVKIPVCSQNYPVITSVNKMFTRYTVCIPDPCRPGS